VIDKFGIGRIRLLHRVPDCLNLPLIEIDGFLTACAASDALLRSVTSASRSSRRSVVLSNRKVTVLDAPVFFCPFMVLRIPQRNPGTMRRP
jgi:hypothetical protein